MLRNTAPGQRRRLRVNGDKKGRKPPVLDPRTSAEVSYSQEKIRRSYEQDVKLHPTHANTWISYIKFEGGKNPERALQVSKRAIKANPCVDVYLQAMKYDPSRAIEALGRFPNSDHIRKAAFKDLSLENARIKLSQWIKDDPGWLETFIDVEMHFGNYSLVSTLYQHWSSTFGAKVALWDRAAQFELKNGTQQGFLEISARALHTLFFSNPTEKPPNRMDFFLDFLKHCKWTSQERKTICVELQKLDLTHLEMTILRREEYRYKLLEEGISEMQLRNVLVKGTSLLRQRKNLTEDSLLFLFESQLASVPPHTSERVYLKWSFDVIDYAEYCNDFDTYQRALSLCDHSAILISSYINFVKVNYPQDMREELIIACMQTSPSYFPTGELLDLETFKKSPRDYRSIFYFRLAKSATSIKSWFAAVDFEEFSGNYDACRSLLELSLIQVKSWKQLGREDVWKKYAELEHRRGTHASYINILRRWFNEQCISSPLLWDELVKYWKRRHGKIGIQNALQAASQITQGSKIHDHINEALKIRWQYEC